MLKKFGQIVSPFQKILLGVSGGVDSMCMAELFMSLTPSCEFSVAHCNFSLRGEDSVADEEFVRSWAESRGVCYHSIVFDTRRFASDNGISIEMAARELRYKWFASLCRDFGYEAVAVAHNANDNAETLLLNLVRGTGMKGLSAMMPVSRLPFSDDLNRGLDAGQRAGLDAGQRVGLDAGLDAGQRVGLDDDWTSDLGADLNDDWLAGLSDDWVADLSDDLKALSAESTARPLLIRPLLDVTRKQIEGYVYANKIAFREDKSNFSSEYKRNKIRNEVLPVLSSINPSVIATLNNDIRYFKDASEIVSDYCRNIAPLVFNDGRIDVAGLMSQKHWRYLLYYILEKYGFNSSVISSLENLLESDRTFSGKRFFSPTHCLITSSTHILIVDSCADLGECGGEYGGLSAGAIVGHSGDAGGYSDGGRNLVIYGPGKYYFYGKSITVEIVPSVEELKQPSNVLLADSSALRFPFILRRWKIGDWMVPFGMRGRKKLSDIFTDAKYSLQEKQKAVIMQQFQTYSEADDSSRVLAILGLRADNSLRVTEHTSSIVKITIN